LRRLFRAWRRGGEVSSVFELKYTPRRSGFTSPLLLRFLRFLVEHPQPTFRAAWQKFSSRGGQYGPGRRRGKPLKISYYKIKYALGPWLFYEIREEQRALRAAAESLLQVRLLAEANIRARYPERPARRRPARGPDFQI
jgi:hypothetical protein